MTGAWDTANITSGAVDVWMLTQTGTTISGTTPWGDTIDGTLTGDALAITITGSAGPLTVNGIVSSDGNKIAGSWRDSAGTTGALDSYRRSAGSGANVTGPWTMRDLSSSNSITIQLSQAGNSITGTFPDYPGWSITGFDSGSLVNLTEDMGAASETVTVNLSVDGNTMTGAWRKSDGATGGARLTRL